MREVRRYRRESGRLFGDGDYTCWHKSASTDWIQDETFDTLEEAERQAKRDSRNGYMSKVVDRSGKVVARFKDMVRMESRTLPLHRNGKFVRNEDNSYSSNMGVDDIEDVMAAGLDWTDDDFEFEKDDVRDYDDPSKLVTIADAEKIIGERPDASKPKPPASKNPRPDTIKKYKDAVASYRGRVKMLGEWEKKYDHLVALVQQLKNTNDRIDELEDDLSNWCASNHGTFLVRTGNKNYSWIQDPVTLVKDIRDRLHIPKEITSLNERTPWYFDNIDFDEDEDVFPTVLITIGNKMMYRIISVPDDLNQISNLIEPYVASLQPKDLKKKTNAKLDQKSQLVVDAWERQDVTNSVLPEDKKDLKLYIASVAFLKEIQQLSKYPASNTVSELVNTFLSQI